MGTAERYCAICGSSLEISGLRTGSNSEHAKRIRKAIIDFGRRRRAGQTSGQYQHHEDESDVPEDEDSYSCEHSYDPAVMACRDTTLPNHDRFIGHVRLVMYDPNIKEPSKYFISGPAQVDDFGWGTVDGGHPERPDEEFENVMYMEYEDDQTKAFPCHGLCLQIAAKVILGVPDSRLLDPKVLYRVMCDDLHDGVDGESAILNLDYGDITTGEQYWECEAGEEVSGWLCNHLAARVLKCIWE